MPSAGTPLGNMVIKLGLDDADFGKGVQNAKKQVNYLSKEMKANLKAFDIAGDTMGKLGAKYNSLTKIIEAQEKQVKGLKKAYDESFVDGKATDSTKRLAGQLQDANGKLNAYKQQLKNTAGALAEFKVKNEGFTGWLNKHGEAYIKQGEAIKKMGDNISKVGSTLTKTISAPAIAGFTLATKAATDFTSQIGAIGPLLTNGGEVTKEYRKQLDQMSNSSKEWAKAYGISTTSINEGLAEVVRKGYDANQTLGVMPSILDATKASGDDFNDVMNVTTETISQFNLKGSDYAETVKNATQVTDSLTYVANATSAGFSDLGLAMGYVGPVANSLNMSVEETASAIGLLSDAGIGGEKAGTALRGALTRLLKPSKQNIEGFKQLGISSQEFRDGTLTLPDILDKIKTNTEGWTDAQRTAAIALAFGTESQSAMNVLVGQGGDALRGLTKDTEGASGATKKIAETMNQLPENKVARFKESLKVLAITFGEKLLPIVTPWIEKATEMVDSFSKLDDATQKNIIKWGLMAAAAGPALKIVGTGVSVFGSARKGIGTLTTGIVNLLAQSAKKSAITELTGALVKTGTAATATAGIGGASGVGALVTGLSAIAGPAAIAIGAIGAIGLALYAGKKAYDDHQLSGAKWGTAVTEEQDKVITKTYEMKEKAVGYIDDYANGVVSAGDKAIKANKDIADSIDKALKKEEERRQKSAEAIKDDAIRKQAEEQIKWQNQITESNAESAKANIENVNKIIKGAMDNNRQLTEGERQIVGKMYQGMTDEQLRLADFSKDQRLAIEESYQGKISKMSNDELIKRRASITEALDKENKEYEKQQEAIKKAFEHNPTALKANLDKQEQLHKNATENMILSYAKMNEKLGYSLEDNASFWERYGYTVQEVQALVTNSALKTTENLDMMANGTSEFDQQWNMLALDPKTGEIKTNMADTLVDLAKTDEGWNSLKLMAKNATLTTNAKEEIAIAMGESGKWNNLYLSEKKAMFDGDDAKVEMLDTIDKLGQWNAYNADRKVLGIDNADVIWKMLDSEEKINTWNSIPADTKTLLANNDDLMAKITSSEETFNTWNSLPVNVKTMLANNEDVLGKIQSGEIALNGYDNNNPALKLLLGDSSSVKNAATTGGNSLNIYTNNNPAQKKLTGDSSSVKNATATGGASLSIYSRNNPGSKYLKALDYASGPANNASGAVSNFANKRNHTVTLTTIFKNITQNITEFFTGKKHATGTNYHPGGLAMVNDQKGSLYRELIQTPDGHMFIPHGRDVVMDLPRGSKVYTASQTKQMIPQYKNGVGVSKTVISKTTNNDMSDLTNTIKRSLNLIGKLTPQINIYPSDNPTNYRKIEKELAWLTSVDGGRM